MALALVLAAPCGFAASDQSASQPATTSTKDKAAHKKSSAAKPQVKAKPQIKTRPHRKAKAKPGDAKATSTQPPAAVAVTPTDAKPADGKSDATKPTETKAPPHFASLRAERVNLRSGPSEDFPIQWVYTRRGLPVEILASFDIWRKVRDFDGTEGWIHQQMLTGRRSVLITGAIRNLRRDPDPTAGVVAQLEPGVVAAISHCTQTWCEIKAGGYKGWLSRAELWGLEPDEIIQ